MRAFNNAEAIKSIDSKVKLESLFGKGVGEDAISSNDDGMETKEDEARKALNDLFK